MLGAVFILALIGGYFYRGSLRSAWEESQKPTLPAEQGYQVSSTSGASSVSSSTTSTVPVKASSTKPTTPLKPVQGTSSTVSTPSISVDPLAWEGAFPTSVNLAVPFLSQAPKMNWNMPYQEACEEASMLMVHAFYQKRVAYTPDEGDQALLDLIAFEESKGKTPDLTSKEVAEIIKQKFGYKNVLVRPLTEVAQMKAALAHGYPVMIPADGKAIGNPNFRNGGPPYHMLVVKGYVGDDYWITNDPGTRKGKDFTYDMQHLVNVVHDWNGGDVPNGKPYMIVVLPNEAVN